MVIFNRNTSLYNAIIAWAEHYPTSRAFGNYVPSVSGKGIYASGIMFNHYYNLACEVKNSRRMVKA